MIPTYTTLTPHRHTHDSRIAEREREPKQPPNSRHNAIWPDKRTLHEILVTDPLVDCLRHVVARHPGVKLCFRGLAAAQHDQPQLRRHLASQERVRYELHPDLFGGHGQWMRQPDARKELEQL